MTRKSGRISKLYKKSSLKSSLIKFTELPPELHLEILDHLKPADKCMKPLSETCRRFRDLCTKHLIHLRLDHFRIECEDANIDIRRAYKKISVIGFENLCDWRRVKNALQASRETAKILKVTELPFGLGKQSNMHLGSLNFLLNSLPNVEEVEINRSVMNLVGSEHETPRLPSLKKLHLSRKSQQAVLAFDKVTSLTELRMPLRYRASMQITSALLIHAQSNLVVLEADQILLAMLPANHLPHLRTFNCVLKHWEVSDILKIAPFLENLTLRIQFIPNFLGAHRLQEYLRGKKSEFLKTLNVIGVWGHFNVLDFLGNFPNLDVANCSPNLPIN